MRPFGLPSVEGGHWSSKEETVGFKQVLRRNGSPGMKQEGDDHVPTGGSGGHEKIERQIRQLCGTNQKHPSNGTRLHSIAATGRRAA